MQEVNVQKLNPDELKIAVARMNAGIEVLRDYVTQHQADGWNITESTLRKHDGQLYGHVTLEYEGHKEFDVPLDSMIDDYLASTAK